MKKLLAVLKSAFIACTLLLAFAGCTKDEAGSLTGHWVFNEANVIFYMSGQAYNVKEHGGDLSGINNGFRGLFIDFKENEVTMGQGSEILFSVEYTVSGNKIVVRDGGDIMSWKYSLSGNSLDVVWTSETLELLGDFELPDGVDDLDVIMTFKKQ